MDNTLFKGEKFTNIEILTYYFNLFSDSLIANCIDLAHYQSIKKTNPDYKKPDQYGNTMTIDMLIDSKKKGALYARQNVEYVKVLMEKEEAGTLADIWADEAIAITPNIVSPIQKADLPSNEEEK